jgi:acetyltransferase-like isoleucine patch superfamily enzyme
MIARSLAALGSRLLALRFRLSGMHIRGPVWLRAVEVPRLAHRIALAQGVALDRGTILLVSGDTTTLAIEIGANVYINRHTMIDACESVRIGADCMIGPFCYITDHDHSRDPAGRPAGGPLVSKPVVLEPRCWIGAHATILKGVVVGAGAIVGAGSVVTKNVPPGAVVAGNPARSIATSAC